MTCTLPTTCRANVEPSVPGPNIAATSSQGLGREGNRGRRAECPREPAVPPGDEAGNTELAAPANTAMISPAAGVRVITEDDVTGVQPALASAARTAVRGGLLIVRRRRLPSREADCSNDRPSVLLADAEPSSTAAAPAGVVATTTALLSSDEPSGRFGLRLDAAEPEGAGVDTAVILDEPDAPFPMVPCSVVSTLDSTQG